MRQAAPALLRRLRVKFVALNMALAALVLAASFAAICYMDYRGDADEVYRTLRQATARAVEKPPLVPDRGLLPQLPQQDDGAGNAADAPGNPNAGDGAEPADGDAEGGAGADGAEDSAGEAEAFAPPQIGGEHRRGSENSLPVAVYYCEGSTALQAIDHSTASVPESVLSGALQTALASESEHGYLPEERLFYAKRDIGGVAIVAFADGGAVDGWRGLALGLAAVGVLALALLFLLNILFSRWALGPVQRAWSQQQQFIADASHELKTPLTVILANNAILRQRGAETIASQAQWVESTQMEAERMQALVADMLDLARPADVISADQPAPVLDFSRLVEGEALTFEAVAFEREITWESTVAEGVQVRGAATRLQRLVAVLLDNACKYTDAGGTVEVRLGKEGGHAVLAVHNSGEPIAAEDLPHLFDRFYRADKARTQAGERTAAPEGYGLGLAIASDIAQAHKGTLSVASTVEAGTTFTLVLPLA